MISIIRCIDHVVLHRMDDKGEVKCIKFSIGNKILAVQRTLKSVVSLDVQKKTLNTSCLCEAKSLCCVDNCDLNY